jgi:hypothetical protein
VILLFSRVPPGNSPLTFRKDIKGGPLTFALTIQQRSIFAEVLADQQLAALNQLPRVHMVGDSPNAGRTVEAVYGIGARPDLRKVIQIGRSFGCLYKAVMVANPGLPSWVVRHYESCGFDTDFGRSADCDDRFVRRCAEAAVCADVLVCIGGDHAPVDVLQLAKESRRRVRVILMAVRKRTHPSLLQWCDRFIELPVINRSLAAA